MSGAGLPGLDAWGLLTWLHIVAAVVVLAEALNKLERTAPLRPGLEPQARLVDGLKALAWLLLALGAAGAIAAPLLLAAGLDSVHLPLLRLDTPTLDQVCVLAGFAVLIVRTRVKEG
jgi:hypothetical protein